MDITINDFFDHRRFSKIIKENPDEIEFNLFNRIKNKCIVTINPKEFLFIPAGFFIFEFDKLYGRSGFNISLKYTSDNDIFADLNPPIFSQNIENIDEYSYDKIEDFNSFIINNKTKIFKVKESQYNQLNCYNWDINNFKNFTLNKPFNVIKSYSTFFAEKPIKYYFPRNYVEIDTISDFSRFSRLVDVDTDNYYKFIVHNANFDEIYKPDNFLKNSELTISYESSYNCLQSSYNDMMITPIQGRKKIIIISPSESENLYLFNNYSISFLKDFYYKIMNNEVFL